MHSKESHELMEVVCLEFGLLETSPGNRLGNIFVGEDSWEKKKKSFVS